MPAEWKKKNKTLCNLPVAAIHRNKILTYNPPFKGSTCEALLNTVKKDFLHV